MITPSYDLTNQHNQINAQIENKELLINKFKSIFSILNEEITLNRGTEKEITEIQLSAVTQAIKARSKPGEILKEIDEKIKDMRDEYLEKYNEYIHQRDNVFENNCLVKISEPIRNRLKRDFQEKLDRKIMDFCKRHIIDENTDLEDLKSQLQRKSDFYEELVEKLLDQKTDLTMKQYDYEFRGSNVIKKLEEEKLNLFNSFEVKNLFDAANIGHLGFVEQKIRKILNDSYLFKENKVKKLLNQKDSRGFAAIHIASDKGRFQIVKKLLKHGADISIQGPYGYQALHWAAKNGSLYLVKELINQGANVNAQGEYRRTPLHMSIFNGHIATSEYLIKHGARINAQTTKEDRCDTPLHIAVKHNKLPLVKLLTEDQGNLDVNIKDSTGATPLYYAVKWGLYRSVCMILGHISFKDSQDDEDINTVENLLKLEIGSDDQDERSQHKIKYRLVEKLLKIKKKEMINVKTIEVREALRRFQKENPTTDVENINKAFFQQANQDFKDELKELEISLLEKYQL